MRPPQHEGSDALTEVRGRTRRIETRLTQLMIGLGISTDSQKPEFLAGQARTQAGYAVVLPSPHSSLREILAAIPAHAIGTPVDLYLGADRIAVLTKLKLDSEAQPG